MKLTYRDKIIAAVLIVIAVIMAGYFGLIKGKTQKLKDNQARLTELNNQKADIDAQIAQIKPLQDEIMEIYNDTNKLSEIFVPKSDIDTTIKLDEYMQKYAEENGVKISKLEVSSPAVANLGYYFNSKLDVGSELRRAADISGALQKEYAESVKEQTALSERTIESLFCTRYGISVTGTKENIWKYLEAIKDIDAAIMINSVQITDWSFGEDAARAAGQALQEVVTQEAPAEEPAEGEEGEGEESETPAEEAAPAEEEAPESTGLKEITTADGTVIQNTSNCDIVISLYSVYNMSEPDVDYIPAPGEVQ